MLGTIAKKYVKTTAKKAASKKASRKAAEKDIGLLKVRGQELILKLVDQLILLVNWKNVDFLVLKKLQKVKLLVIEVL
jgi:hypothetical protein